MTATVAAEINGTPWMPERSIHANVARLYMKVARKHAQRMKQQPIAREPDYEARRINDGIELDEDEGNREDDAGQRYHTGCNRGQIGLRRGGRQVEAVGDKF